MKKPVVDYRELRLSNLCSPRFSHLFLLLGWVGFFVMYFLTENLIAPEDCFVVHCALDDLIPFNEYFLIFYCGWYALIALSLGYFLLYNVQSFKNLQTYIIITQVVAMAVYIIFPTRQDLRPDSFARDNLFTQLAALLYRVDTSTGVCPSLHIGYSLGIASVWLREKGAHPAVKTLICLFLLGVCASVVFVKQHSVLDILAALPLCALAEWLTFSKRSPLRRKI